MAHGLGGRLSGRVRTLHPNFHTAYVSSPPFRSSSIIILRSSQHAHQPSSLASTRERQHPQRLCKPFSPYVPAQPLPLSPYVSLRAVVWLLRRVTALSSYAVAAQGAFVGARHARPARHAHGSRPPPRRVGRYRSTPRTAARVQWDRTVCPLVGPSGVRLVSVVLCVVLSLPCRPSPCEAVPYLACLSPSNRKM